MINHHAAYKYETPYKGPFLITQCCTNGTVALQCGAIKNRYNIHHIEPHKSYTNIEDIDLKTNDLQRHISKVIVIYFCILLKLVTNYLIECAQRPWL